MTYVCRDCFKTFRQYERLRYHFNRHPKQRSLQIGKKVKRKNWKFTSLDSRNGSEIDLSNDNILSYVGGYKYQIYYKGQAIGEDESARITQRFAKRRESEWLLCEAHKDCGFREPEGVTKASFNRNSIEHFKATFFTFLCRHCLRTYCTFASLRSHFRLHSKIL